MIIRELYKVLIEPSSYNVEKDATVTITVKAIDFNNEPVSSANLTLECSKGYFTKNNNTNISGTSTTSISQYTNTSGYFTATYKASEDGLINFTVGDNTNVQIYVEPEVVEVEWEKIYDGNDLKLYVKDGLVFIRLYADSNSYTTSSWKTFLSMGSLSIDSDYYPPVQVYSRSNQGVDVRLNEDGTFQAVGRTQSVSNYQVVCTFTYLSRSVTTSL